MIEANQHIIKRQIIDVGVSDKRIGTEVQDRISKLYESTIVPIIDDVLCGLNVNHEILRIDRLELDLGNLRLESFRDDLRVQLKSKLEDELIKIVYQSKNKIFQKGVEVRKLSGSEDFNEVSAPTPLDIKEDVLDDFGLFEEYLKTGMIPWWMAKKQTDIPQLFRSFIETDWRENEINRLFKLLRFRNVRIRLINTLKDVDLPVFFSKISEPWGDNVMRFFSDIQSLLNRLDRNNAIRRFPRIEILDGLFKEIILSKPSHHRDTMTELASSIVGDFLLKNFDSDYIEKFQSEFIKIKQWGFSLIDEEKFKASLAKVFVGKAIFKSEDQNKIAIHLNTNTVLKEEHLESLKVENAGLVLLWPYLQIFFRELGLLDSENQFHNESSTWRAIHLLHYLIAGTEVAEESEFILNKLICNLPLEASLPITFELTEFEKLECENLLKVIVQNWQAIKSTSTTGLRQSFIMREGIFSKDQSGWTLRVERKSYDLLLDKLSWPISVLKLPWNPYIIHVKW